MSLGVYGAVVCDMLHTRGTGTVASRRYDGWILSKVVTLYTASLMNNREVIMAKRKVTKKSQKDVEVSRETERTYYRDLKYVEIVLTQADKTKVVALADNPVDMLMAMDDMIRLGYTIKVNETKTEGKFKATANGDTTLCNHGYMMNGVASSPIMALTVLVYKVAVKTRLEKWETEEVEGEWFA